MNPSGIDKFKQVVWGYYGAHSRSLAWRDVSVNQADLNYRVFVSEVMLQQTQVPRVENKFNQWMERFPDFKSIAEAPFSDVLLAWNGLGYNRRARYLYEASKKIMSECNGVMPDSLEILATMPGIGRNTAAAIITYAFNKPVVFIETNIRTVYIHHFFTGSDSVSDAELTKIVAATVDTTKPREWYWALMDYGAYLKKQEGNISRRSKHYVRQSAFEGSRRQVRGLVLKQLVAKPRRRAELKAACNDSRLDEVLKALESENLIAKERSYYRLAD